MLQRVAWPPTGSAATFASRTRAELQRHGGRYDLNRREINRYMVEIHKKYAIPVAAVVFVLIGAPVGVRFRRGGVGMVIGISLAVFCVYYVFLIGGEDLADRSIISPFWAMWAPNVLFASLGGLILYYVSWGNLRIHRRLPTSERRAARVAAKSPQSERVGSRIA
ncbi:MAG: LptF/LptG family permease, partial [Gemmatimonadota bacterium]|jgi:lipopolysaccharide export LptBFGC system permease protein LptF